MVREETEYEVRDLIHLALDGNEWRNIVNMVMNLLSK